MAYEGTMKYFILKNKDNNPFPEIINWSQTLDVRKLTTSEYQKLPNFILLNAKLGLDGIFPDFMEKPIPLFSREAMEVISLYDASIPFLFVALFDTRKGECSSYFCPVLEEVDCLARQLRPGKREIVLNREKMSELPLFRVKTGLGSAVIIRMDLAESLLERGAVGVGLEEVCLVEGTV